MLKITDQQIRDLATKYGIEYAALMAIMHTETPMQGFDKNTGKLLIQFEPAWFRKSEPFAPSGLWSVNKVDVQSKEWLAFNNAVSIDADSAMLSTSIGLPQILGIHFKRCGYTSVGQMWDEFKKGEYNQVEALCRFIRGDARLFKAVVAKDWHLVATYYNGAGYKALAERLKREPYNITLEKYYNRFSGLFISL